MAADSHHPTDDSNQTDLGTCPECGSNTDVIQLAGEPMREACPTFCSWKGRNLTESEKTEVLA